VRNRLETVRQNVVSHEFSVSFSNFKRRGLHLNSRHLQHLFLEHLVPVSFHDFAAERLHYNVNICRDKKVIYTRHWIECSIVSVGHLLGPNEYLSYEDYKAKYHDAIVNFMLYFYAQLDITKLNLDLNLKKSKQTVILMKPMYGNACQEVVPSTFICILSKTMTFL